MRSIRKPLLALSLLACVVAGPALAQQTSGYPPPCEASKVSKGDVDRAHTVFLSGKQFLEESNYDKAISYFKDAYTIDCSVHAILPIIATAYERKGDKAEAVRALEEYLKRAPNAPDHDVVERRIKNLNDQLAREQPAAPTATSPPPAATAAPAPTPTNTTPPAPPEAPTAQVTASAASPGAEAGAPSEHTVGPWVVVGVGAVAIIGGAVLEGIGAGDVSTAQQACPTRQSCAKDVASQGNDGRSKQLLGGIVIAAGAGALAGGLIWHFLEKPAGARTARIAPMVAPGYAGLSIDQAF
ncbi:MAG TPA: hypothetical protein VKU41_06305 [Polyangiaceae bacterium]|nr:hypothetical protein [Polyangiaceae bacterium]